MKKKICPIMSRARIDHSDVRNVTALAPGLILCQGSTCLAFGSRPAYEYLGKDSRAKLPMGDLQIFDRDDESPELKALLAQGWERNNPQYISSSLRRSIEPNCWCNAMAGNAQCRYEAP